MRAVLGFLTGLLPIVLVPGLTAAADAQGNFAMKGTGRLSCEVFLEERESKSKLYWNVGGWIDGYITGHNVQAEGTFDAVPFVPLDTADAMVVLLARHCQANPGDPIGLVIKAMVDEMRPVHLQEQSEVVEVEVKGQSYRLYRQMIGDMQRTLADLGHYDGAIDNAFGPNTRAALESFQAKQGLNATGRPTADTLLRILFIQNSE